MKDYTSIVIAAAKSGQLHHEEDASYAGGPGTNFGCANHYVSRETDNGVWVAYGNISRHGVYNLEVYGFWKNGKPADGRVYYKYNRAHLTPPTGKPYEYIKIYNGDDWIDILWRDAPDSNPSEYDGRTIETPYGPGVVVGQARMVNDLIVQLNDRNYFYIKKTEKLAAIDL